MGNKFSLFFKYYHSHTPATKSQKFIAALNEVNETNALIALTDRSAECISTIGLPSTTDFKPGSGSGVI